LTINTQGAAEVSVKRYPRNRGRLETPAAVRPLFSSCCGGELSESHSPRRSSSCTAGIDEHVSCFAIHQLFFVREFLDALGAVKVDRPSTRSSWRETDNHKRRPSLGL
jgi:hypothetical protein